MEGSQISRPAILSFDHRSFDRACAELMQQVLKDGRPDVLIGIKTGGFYVADAMADSATRPIPVLPVTCRRPSTGYKNRLGVVKKIIARLPRPVVDRLRVVEHAVLTRKPRSAVQENFEFDPYETQALEAWLVQAGPSPHVVIVDDAVDSGATLSRVLTLVTDRAPPQARIRSAVITVTTQSPLVDPHYTLHRQQLCRFPWSLDG